MKHCHGYLLHEFLSARARAGRFGGPTLAERTRLARALIVAAVRDAAPALAHRRAALGLRRGPASPRGDGRGEAGAARPALPARLRRRPGDPVAHRPRRAARAGARTRARCGVSWINVTASSPYYAPHVQRPALFPPSDGYPPPEDPLVGVARLLDAARAHQGGRARRRSWSRRAGPTCRSGSRTSRRRACARAGSTPSGSGAWCSRIPSCPPTRSPAGQLARKLICRTFSDCTTAPRNGLVSGCYPLDDFYRERPEHDALEARKRGARA